MILSADPTPNKGYSIWIGKLLISKNIILPEDASKILDKINLFEEFKKKGKIKGVDINRLKTYQELASIVEEAGGTKTQGEEFRESLETGQELIFQDAKFKVVKITTTEACTELCRGMENWCVKDPKYSKGYLEKGPIILVYKNNSPYVLIHEQSGSAKDVQDESISIKIARDLAEIVEHLGVTIFIGDLKTMLRGLTPKIIKQKLNTYFLIAYEKNLISLEECIAIGADKDPVGIAAICYNECRRLKTRIPKYEKYIIADPRHAYHYASRIIDGPWPEAEAVIAKNADSATWYARDVIKGRWPEGEEAISKSGYASFTYARDVIRGRFPAGEAAIIENAHYAFDYATEVIKDRFPLGEERIRGCYLATQYNKFLANLPNNKMASVYSKIVTAISKEQVLTQLQNKFKDTPEQIEQILQADPTPNKGYSIWIGKLLISKNIILPEDTSKILEKINLFEEFKKKGKIKGVDINRLKTYQELAQAVEEASGQKTQGEEFRENLETGQELIFQDGTFKVVKITTTEASAKLCRGTEWCVKDPEYAVQYLEQGPLILVYKNNSPYVLIHEETGSAKDVQDESIRGIVGEELAGIINHLGVKTFKDDLEVIINAVPDEKIFKSLDTYFLEAYSRGMISLDECIAIGKDKNPVGIANICYQFCLESTSQIPKYENLILKSPLHSLWFAKRIVKGRWPKGEASIASDASSAHYYASDVVKGRWPEGEAAIASNPMWAFDYAEEVVNGRFPEGEATIATRADYATKYAEKIIGGRFPEGEAVIATDTAYAYQYAQDIIRERFPAGEAAIGKDAYHAFNYAEQIIKGRFPEGEALISENPWIAYRYAKNIIKGRWPEAEPAIATNNESAYRYARYVIGGRWPMGEKAIMEYPEFAHLYARDVIKGRWPEAEKVILKHGEFGPQYNYFISNLPSKEAKNYSRIIQSEINKNMKKLEVQAVTKVPVNDGSGDYFTEIQLFPATMNIAPGKQVLPVQVGALRKERSFSKGTGTPTSLTPETVFLVSAQPIFATRVGAKETILKINEPVPVSAIIRKEIFISKKAVANTYDVGIYYNVLHSRSTSTGGYSPLGKITITIAGAPVPDKEDLKFQAIMDKTAAMNNLINGWQMRIKQLMGDDTNNNNLAYYNYLKSAVWKFMKNADKPIVTAAMPTLRDMWRGISNPEAQRQLQQFFQQLEQQAEELSVLLYDFVAKNPRHKDAIAMTQLYSVLHMTSNNRDKMSKYQKENGVGQRDDASSESLVKDFDAQMRKFSVDGKSVNINTAVKYLRTILQNSPV